MQTIHKFNLQAMDDVNEIQLPKGAAVLSFQSQHDKPTIWVSLDTNNEMQTRKFVLVATGGAIPNDSFYHGTAQTYAGNFVLHLFELLHQPELS